VDIELLTIQIRLVICSVDKAMEMGMNWWTTDANLSPHAKSDQEQRENGDLKQRVERLERTIQSSQPQ